jgi:hypothetical protein
MENIELPKSEELVRPPTFDEKQEMYDRVSTLRETFDSNIQVFIAKEFKDTTETLTDTLTELANKHEHCEKAGDEQGREDAKEEINKTIIEFFGNNAGKEEIYIIAPSSTYVTRAIAIYFSKNYLKSFENDEIKCSDAGEIIIEPLNNIAKHRNPDPTHQNHVFYFHSSIDKAKGIINFEFTDFNFPIPEEVKESIYKHQEYQDEEEPDEEEVEKLKRSIEKKSIKEVEGFGSETGHLGLGLGEVNQLTKVKDEKTLNFGNWYEWYDKKSGKYGDILGNKITCSMEL